jgi:putative SOS response-associated peptidase YedK
LSRIVARSQDPPNGPGNALRFLAPAFPIGPIGEAPGKVWLSETSVAPPWIRQQYPYWAKEPKIGLSTINAKAETVATAPAFKEAFKRRRCLVPADAFFEWQRIDAKTKQPFAIAMKDARRTPLQAYGTAGDPETKEPLESFTVITTDPNELVEPLHNRMPVILQSKDYDRWLAPGDPEHLPVDLLRPFPAEGMKAWRVDRKVGNVRNDTPDCIEPMTEDEPPSLFA